MEARGEGGMEERGNYFLKILNPTTGHTVCLSKIDCLLLLALSCLVSPTTEALADNVREHWDPSP